MNATFAKELERATKKAPPKMTRVSLIFNGIEDDERDENLAEKEGQEVFKALRADLEGRGEGKIVIGHASGQSTGIGGSISGRFIPTVVSSRESLVSETQADPPHTRNENR